MMILVNRLPSLGLPVGGAVRVAAVQAKPFLQQAVSGRWELLTGGPTAPRNKLVFEINLVVLTNWGSGTCSCRSG